MGIHVIFLRRYLGHQKDINGLHASNDDDDDVDDDDDGFDDVDDDDDGFDDVDDDDDGFDDIDDDDDGFDVDDDSVKFLRVSRVSRVRRNWEVACTVLVTLVFVRSLEVVWLGRGAW